MLQIGIGTKQEERLQKAETDGRDGWKRMAQLDSCVRFFRSLDAFPFWIPLPNHDCQSVYSLDHQGWTRSMPTLAAPKEDVFTVAMFKKVYWGKIRKSVQSYQKEDYLIEYSWMMLNEFNVYCLPLSICNIFSYIFMQIHRCLLRIPLPEVCSRFSSGTMKVSSSHHISRTSRQLRSCSVSATYVPIVDSWRR